MQKHHFVTGLVLAALLTAPAMAASPDAGPLLTDPSGDVTIHGLVGSEKPAIDIVAADIDTNARSLAFTISVVDLPESGTYEQYSMTARTGGRGFHFVTSHRYGSEPATASIWSVEDEGFGGPVPVTFDTAADTVTFTATFETLSTLTGAPVSQGTLISDITAAASDGTTLFDGETATNVGGARDEATTEAIYTV